MPHLLFQSVWLRCLILLSLLTIGGCSLFRTDPGDSDQNTQLKELMKAPEPPELIREATAAHGMRPIELDGVSVVHQLPSTGGPPDPSIYRDQLMEEMKHRDFINPNHFLEMKDTALVRVRATIPAGARRGDRIDVRVIAPKESRSSDLHGGWLLDTRLRQQQVLQNAVRQSDVMAIGTGTVLTRADYTPGSDQTLRIEGNVLGGGLVQESREVGLILRPKYQHAKMAAAIASAINRRYFFFDGSTRRGIAKPVADDFIQLEVHPRYRDSLPRMMEVVRAIATNPNTSDSQSRLAELAKRISKPATASDAALQLEGIGENAVPTLLEALQNNNPELKFYAAEALAYLDRDEAIAPLAELVVAESAFRQPALLALQGLEKPQAVDALVRLMNEPSLETRYGAFCAIRRRADGRRRLAGKSLTSFTLYQVDSPAAPAVVVSLRDTPEIVLFGDLNPIQLQKFMMGSNGWILKPDVGDPTQIRISRFQPEMEDRRATSSYQTSAFVQAITSAGGSYGDVISLLRQAKDAGYMTDQLAIDPLPRARRTYYRDQSDSDSSAKVSEADLEITGTAN